MKNLGLTEIIIIGIVLIVFFGGKRAKSIAKTAGESTRELKKVKKEFGDGMTEMKDEVSKSLKDEDDKK